LVLDNWVATLLAAIGGLVFAVIYRRSGSLLQFALEHSLWGAFLFTLGMGVYFYGGSLR